MIPLNLQCCCKNECKNNCDKICNYMVSKTNFEKKFLIKEGCVKKLKQNKIKKKRGKKCLKQLQILFLKN